MNCLKLAILLNNNEYIKCNISTSDNLQKYVPYNFISLSFVYNNQIFNKGKQIFSMIC